MKMKSRIASIITLFSIVVTLFSPKLYISADEDTGFKKQTTEDKYQIMLQNENLCLAVNTADGGITVTDNQTGLTFRSNPIDAKDNTGKILRTRMATQSQLILILADNIGNQTLINSAVASVNKSGLTVYKSDDSVKIVYGFPDYNIVIPVIYTLENGMFTASIDTANIKSEDKDLLLREIQLLPYFGAADVGDEGYYIVPDGCGAVINFHSGKSPVYKQALYGNDRGRTSENTFIETQSALLPMLATSYTLYNGTSAGLVQYVEEGDALAFANVDAETTDGYYNSAYFSFKYRNYDEVTLMDRSSSAKKVNLNEENHTACKSFKVSYTILSGKNDFVSLAEKVRERVFNGNVPAKIQNDELPVYLRIFMSIRKTKYFLGIPYNGNQKLTDLSGCRSMLESFNEMPVVMSLIGLESDGAVGGRIDDRFKIIRSLGSVNELKELTDVVENTGGAVYPAAEFTEFTKGNRNNRIKSVAGLTLSIKYFDYGTMNQNADYGEVYILKSSSILKNVNSWIKSAVQKDISYCAPISLSNSPYRSGGDFGEDRERTKQYFIEAFNNFNNNNIKLLSESAAAYAIPYSEHIRSMPISSSGYAACNYEVPFLQMVLHGIKSYSLPSVNLSGNWENYFLKAIETGSSIDFTFIESDFSEIKGTPLDTLNGASFSLCKEKSVKLAKELSQCMKGTANALITDYRVITPQVRAVVYENGECFIINYGNTDYCYNGAEIKAKDYIKVGREVLE